MIILPKTKIGKRAIWFGLSGLIVISLLNIISNNLYCEICPEGYRLDKGRCNPVCYYAVSNCLSPSVEPTCNLNENSIWRLFDIVLGLLALASILYSGVLSLTSVIKHKERALLIFAMLLLWLLALGFIFGEIFIGH